MSTQRTWRRPVGVGATILLGVSLVACSGSQTPTESTDDASGKITVWSWSTNAAEIADLFMEEHPDIEVELINPGDGPTTQERTATAFQAGTGAPDVVMIEHDDVFENAAQGYIVPLTDFGIDEIADDFAPSLISQLTYDGEVYGTPIDGSPMALFYRADLFEQAGIEPPATWDEFATAAETLKTALPDSFIANTPFAEGGIPRMFWQTGSGPFTIDGENIAVDYDSEAYTEVVDYWLDLHERGLTADLPIWSPEWNAGFADGTMAAWIGPGWAPVILGSSAESSAGAWAVATLPSWDADAPASPEWGGSSYTVTEQSENKAAAAEYVKWVNHDPAAYELLFELTGSFPVLNEYLNDEEFLSTPFEFFGDQPVNQVLAEAMKVVPTDWQWTPFNSEVNRVTDEELQSLLEGTISSQEALVNIQDRLREYASSQGFTVED